MRSCDIPRHVGHAADAGWRAGVGNRRAIGICNAPVIRSINNLFRKKTRGSDSIEEGGVPQIYHWLRNMSLRTQQALDRE
jgi:hypothetical protein